MTKRIFRTICSAAVFVFLACVLLIMGVLYDYFTKLQQRQLRIQTHLAAQAVANEGLDYFTGLDAGVYRMTWVDGDGTVLWDTGSDASQMENHLNREEIKQALFSGFGESTRYSDTLTQRFFYAAQRLPDGSVLRLAGRQYTVWVLLLGILQPMLLVALIAVTLSLILAFRLSKQIVRPLNELNLDDPQLSSEYRELQPLTERIRSQKQQLEFQSSKLRRKQEEFNAAADNMSEGLVLLNRQGTILSINRAAARLLSASEFCVGKDIRVLNHSLVLQELLQQARSGCHADAVIQTGDQSYQFSASPVCSGEETTGIALLILDITQRQKAEQMRREFTANVSHELKTPLHAISGYAELMKDGIARPEDIPLFSGRIYTETQRMISLIDDIISLSRLDEGEGTLRREKTDLYCLAEGVMHTLRPQAEAAGISLTLRGTSAVLLGIPQLLNGILFNLIDNAIKYNRPNGSVSVEIVPQTGEIILTVSDTGIGIPEEHLERVFERFYRVDKSRSKQAGGTGLGLSIVKHAAKLHNASIDLRSTPDTGTAVTLRFPVQQADPSKPA